MRDEFDTKIEDQHRRNQRKAEWSKLSASMLGIAAPPRTSSTSVTLQAEVDDLERQVADRIRQKVTERIEARRRAEANPLRRIWRWLFAPLLALMAAVSVPAIDVPDELLHAIAAVEVGADWHPGSICSCSRGAIGEASCFQLSPAVLRQMHAPSAWYVHCHPDVAAAFARRWLAHLYACTGNWPAAIAAYHVGLHGPRRPGRAYANRVLALATI